jgi:hypothetical protein
MNSVALKLILTPVLVGAATLAGRRWGPTISGWLVALPYTAGPIIFFLALSQGLAFASATAVGVMAGVLSTLSFCLTYGWLSRRLGMPRTLAASIGVFALAVLLLRPLPLWWPLVYPAVIIVLLLALRLMPRPTAAAPAAVSPPQWEIPARMLVATCYVLLLTAGAPLLGPQLTGLMTPFPLFGGTLAVFAHQFQGPEAAVSVLRGLLHGLFAFASFFVVLSALLERAGLAVAFGVAIVVALLVQAGSFWLMRRRAVELPPSQPGADDPVAAPE